MHSVSLPAHFDGEHILLDAPFELKPNAKLLITVLSESDEERDDWLRLSAQGLEGAYAEDEEGYFADSIKEANPEYERR